MKLASQNSAGRLPRRIIRFAWSGVQRPRKLVKTWRDARTVASAHGLGTFRILREQMLLRIFHSISLRTYYQYRLFNPDLSWQEKQTYLPSSPDARRQLRALLAPRKYRCIYFNKLIFKQFFGASGFPLAKLYGLYDPVLGYTTDGRGLKNAADIRAWLQTSGVQEFVFKPLEGEQGLMLLVVVGRAADDPDKMVTLGGDTYDAEGLVAFSKANAKLKANQWSNTRSFLIEERIHQHPELVALIGPTLCCVRVQTIIARDGTPRVMAAILKIQPKLIGVDNLLHGAVGAWVDLDSGALGRGRNLRDLAYISLIPGTDTPFVGFQLPFWAEVKDLALRAAAAFPWMHSIGWDIAISEQGPVLIEGNPAWSVALLQIPAPHGLMTGEFKALYEALRRGEGG